MEKRLQVGIKAITKAGDYLRGQFLKKHRVSLKKDKTVLLGEDLSLSPGLLPYRRTRYELNHRQCLGL